MDRINMLLRIDFVMDGLQISMRSGNNGLHQDFYSSLREYWYKRLQISPSASPAYTVRHINGGYLDRDSSHHLVITKTSAGQQFKRHSDATKAIYTWLRQHPEIPASREEFKIIQVN